MHERGVCKGKQRSKIVNIAIVMTDIDKPHGNYGRGRIREHNM